MKRIFAAAASSARLTAARSMPARQAAIAESGVPSYSGSGKENGK